MNHQSVQRAITPLRLIFWGGLICVIDLKFSETTNGVGIQLDLLDDALGAVLIAVGVFKLSAIVVNHRYATVMLFVQVVSILFVVDAVFDHFVMPLSPPLRVAGEVFDFVTLLAIVAFCVAMRWFCETATLYRAAYSWWVTTFLFVVFYVVPLCLVELVRIPAMASGRILNLDLGLSCLLLPLLVVPITHLFVSTSRMKRAAERETMNTDAWHGPR